MCESSHLRIEDVTSSLGGSGESNDFALTLHIFALNGFIVLLFNIFCRGVSCERGSQQCFEAILGFLLGCYHQCPYRCVQLPFFSQGP